MPERSRAFFFHPKSVLESCVNCSLDGLDWFRHLLRFLPLPSIRKTRNYLNPLLIRGWLDSVSELIFRVSPQRPVASPLRPVRAAPIDQIWAFFSILGCSHF
jgi:hypothetical protein